MNFLVLHSIWALQIVVSASTSAENNDAKQALEGEPEIRCALVTCRLALRSYCRPAEGPFSTF